MKVWRAEVTASAPGKSNWVEILDFAARCSAPVLLLLVCLFVAAQVVTSENLVLKIGDAAASRPSFPPPSSPSTPSRAGSWNIFSPDRIAISPMWTATGRG